MTEKAGQLMKNNRVFILVEAVLAIIAVILAAVMLHGNNQTEQDKIAVIIQNSDDNQWAAFKYGLKMAAADYKVEMFVVDTEGAMSAKSQRSMIKQEIDNGADAVIVQPAPGTETEKILKKIAKQVPVMLIGSSLSKGQTKSALSVAEPDNYAIGKALADSLLKDYSGNISGKTLGILAETKDSKVSADRRKGLDDGLKNKGASVIWSATSPAGTDKDSSLEILPAADLVVALDDDSLTEAGACAAANNLHGAVVYGVGHSTEAIYYLDIDAVGCLVIPDEFNIGYQSLAETAKTLQHPLRKAEDSLVSYKVMHRDELFSKENQKLLFTMNQ